MMFRRTPKSFGTFLLAIVIPISARCADVVSAEQQRDPSQNAALLYLQAITEARLLYQQISSTNDHHRMRLLSDCEDVVLDPAAVSLSQDPSLRFVKLGADREYCDWGVHNDGWAVVLKHTHYARVVMELMILRARHHFEQGQEVAAVDDLLDTMVFARHIGADPYLICKFSQAHFERRAIHVLARNVLNIEPELLKTISERIDQLPPSASMFERRMKEKELFVDYLKRLLDGTVDVDPIESEETSRIERIADMIEKASYEPTRFVWSAEIRHASMDDLKSWIPPTEELLDESARILAVPDEEFPDAYQAFADHRSHSNPIAKLIVNYPISSDGDEFDSVGDCRRVETYGELRMMMLKAGIAVVMEGVDALKSPQFKDPFGDGPLTIRWCDPEERGDFELQSQHFIDGKLHRTISFIFGD